MPEFRPLAIGDLGWLVMQHGQLYAEHEGFDATFEPLVAEILVDFVRNHDATSEAGWIVWDEDRRLGSIFCVRQSADVAKLRLFLLLPEARGRGIGAQMLAHCMGFARAAGYTRMELWTHASHKAACALYAKAGFKTLSSRPVHSFGVDLIEQIWGIDL